MRNTPSLRCARSTTCTIWRRAEHSLRLLHRQARLPKVARLTAKITVLLIVPELAWLPRVISWRLPHRRAKEHRAKEPPGSHVADLLTDLRGLGVPVFHVLDEVGRDTTHPAVVLKSLDELGLCGQESFEQLTG